MSLLTEFEPCQTFDGGLPSIMVCYEDASETFTQGQAVAADDSAGTVREPTAADPVTAEADILGIASVNATGTTNTELGIWLLDNRTVFKGAVADGGAPTLGEIFDDRDLVIVAGAHSVHEATGTQSHFLITGITGTTAGDRYLVIGGLGSTILSKIAAA